MKINKICENYNFEDYTELMKYLFINDLYYFNYKLSEIFYIDEKTMKLNFQKSLEYLKTKIKEEKNEEIIRCLSCIYGAFIADSMGAYTEFNKPSKENYKKIFEGNGLYGKKVGSITDDSEMAICLSYGIMSSKNIKEISSVNNYYFYGSWFKSNPIDIGYTTRIALKPFSFDKFDPDKIDFKSIYANYEKDNIKSKANGFMMRLSTFIVWFYIINQQQIKQLFSNSNEIDSNLFLSLYQKAKTEANKDNKCTHSNSELSSASAYYTIIGISAIYGFTNEQILSIIYKLINITKDLDIDDKYLSNITESYLNKFKEYNDEPFELFGKGSEQVFDKMGWYINGYKLTLYYIIKLRNYKNEENISAFRKIMNEVNNFGGDTDSNGAIIGAIIGPMLSIKSFELDFNIMINSTNENRTAFSPPLMYFYVYYLIYVSKSNINVCEKKMVLKLFLSCFYDNNHTLFKKIIKDYNSSIK